MVNLSIIAQLIAAVFTSSKINRFKCSRQKTISNNKINQVNTYLDKSYEEITQMPVLQ